MSYVAYLGLGATSPIDCSVIPSGVAPEHADFYRIGCECQLKCGTDTACYEKCTSDALVDCGKVCAGVKPKEYCMIDCGCIKSCGAGDKVCHEQCSNAAIAHLSCNEICTQVKPENQGACVKNCQCLQSCGQNQDCMVNCMKTVPPKPQKKKEEKDYAWIGWVMAVGVVGVGAAIVASKKKKKPGVKA